MAKDGSRKRKREKPSMHPHNKYAENPPDFNLLASHYPSFKEYVSYTPNGRAKIDWTDFNATRELTRVLLAHDFGIHWWIPDGQLCPTVPNRANYIHWIQDLQTNFPAPWHAIAGDSIKGLDIGTGANCIYPLLGAAIHGWHFIGTDATDTALEWARWNVQQNSHLAGLISIRSVRDDSKGKHGVINTEKKEDEKCNFLSDSFDRYKKQPSPAKDMNGSAGLNVSPPPTDCCPELEIDRIERSSGQEDLEEVCPGHENLPILAEVVREAERFDFCMCNPPFFASMEEAGLNPHTSCGGTSAEMVYPGGEEGFISKMIEDSTQLKEQIHWFTTMVGRKVNLKILTSKLREKKVWMLRTTEFVQGRTCRWGLAWTYNAPSEHLLQQQARPVKNNNVSFMIEGVPRQCKAYNVLQELASNLRDFGATCEVDAVLFVLKGCLQDNLDKQLLDVQHQEASLPSTETDAGHFTLSVFEQAPGALMIKGKLSEEKSLLTGKFSAMLSSIEQRLKHRFCAKREQIS